MDSEMKELLELTRENNKILRKMRRAAAWGSLFKLLWWGLILASTVGAYYYFQPMIDGLLDTYTRLLKATGTLDQAGKNIQNLLK